MLGHPLRRAVQVTNQGVGSLGREKVHAQVSRAQRGLYPIPACIDFQRYGTNLVELPLVAHLDPIRGQTERIAPAVRSRSGQIERQGTGESVPGQIHPVQIATVYTTVDTDLSESFGQTAAQIQSQLQSLVRSGDSPGQVVVPESRFQTDSLVVEPVVVELPDLQRSIDCSRRRQRFEPAAVRLEAHAEQAERVFRQETSDRESLGGQFGSVSLRSPVEHALDSQQAGIDGQLDGGVQGSGIGFQCPREPDVLRYGDSVPQRGVGQQDRYEAEIVE